MLKNLLCSIILFCSILGCYLLPAQEVSLEQQAIGLYISSRSFEIDDLFNLKVGQFLRKGEEDRSYVGNLERELIIQLGELLCAQIKALGQADTVYFLNGEPEMARALQQNLDFRYMQMRGSPPELQSLDQILVLSPFQLSSRIHKSVYIRSNRMYTERIPVEVFQFRFHRFLPRDPNFHQTVEVCFDRLDHKLPDRYITLLRNESQFGKVLGDAFSQWWGQWQYSWTGHCTE